MEIAVVVAIAVIAVGIVVMPLLRKPAVSQVAGLSDEALNEQVKSYRAALTNKTLCERCLTANPAGSRFCAECGRSL